VYSSARFYSYEQGVYPVMNYLELEEDLNKNIKVYADPIAIGSTPNTSQRCETSA
jgi:hypothetical protein